MNTGTQKPFCPLRFLLVTQSGFCPAIHEGILWDRLGPSCPPMEGCTGHRQTKHHHLLLPWGEMKNRFLQSYWDMKWNRYVCVYLSVCKSGRLHYYCPEDNSLLYLTVTIYSSASTVTLTQQNLFRSTNTAFNSLLALTLDHVLHLKMWNLLKI